MNFTALTLLSVATGLGQAAPAAPDYYPFKQRSVIIDIDYKPEHRKDIQQIQLCVCRNQSGVWEVVDTVTPDKERFQFTAKEDGLYWLNRVIVYRNGQKDPPDVSRVPPAQKLLLDATPPVLRITTAKREGDEVLVEWTVEEKFPNDAATQVRFRGMGPTDIYQSVPAGAISNRSARFRPATMGPISVQVTVQDLVGNTTQFAREIPGADGTGTGGSSATTVAKLAPDAEPKVNPIVEPPAIPGTGASGIVPPATPVIPTGATGSMPAPVIPPESPTPTPTPTPGSTPPATFPTQPSTLPTPENPGSGNPDWNRVGPESTPKPIASANVTPSPSPATSNVPVVNYTKFDIQYQVENGPSGVSRIDLYATRDDGRTWVKWSQHDGRESPLRVVLDGRGNPNVEGEYGFRIVPVSGAGLSDGPPTAGSPPEMRVNVDVTPPMIAVYPPTADSRQRNTLLLHWKATDRNFGKDPIAIEWSEHPAGPWKSVTSGDAVVPVAGGTGVGPNRIPNTGTYAWGLPAGLATPKVYLRFSAWDAAGNKSEAVTPEPVLVDLTKPRAKIQGIVGTSRP